MAESTHFVTSHNNRLLIALFGAIIVHVLVLGINFSAPEPKPANKAIEITLVTTKTPKPPQHARLLAQENQIGSGQKVSKPSPPKQKIPSEEPEEKKVLTKSPEPTPPKPQIAQKVITQKVIEKPMLTAKKADQISVEPKPVPLLSAEALRMQIAQLGTQIVKKEQQGEDVSNIKHISAVSTHKYVAAQYISDWERKIEQIGNLNYPEIARKNNFTGRLTMDVGINEDGSIYSIRINKSSGYPELDDAAKKIVRMSAPFAPLPRSLLKELNVLIVTRVWSFSDESGLSTK
ncbi:MAG: TonB family protein [Methylococcaceae bacterium]